MFFYKGSSGFGSVNKLQIERRTFDIVNAGLQLSFKISSQIDPAEFIFG